MELRWSCKNKPLDLVLIWTQVDNDSVSGRNGLVKLAIRVLSVIANSAGCERAFSDFGIIHTKRRNKLSAEKVHKTGIYKMSIRQTHAEAGLTRPRRKRAFGEIDQEEEPTEAAVPEEDNSDFTDLARRLIRDSEASDEGIGNGAIDDLVPVIHLPARSPTPAAIMIRNLAFLRHTSHSHHSLTILRIQQVWTSIGKGG